MGFRDEFLSRLRKANHNDGPDIFPMSSKSSYTTPPPRKSTVYHRTDVAPPRGYGYWLLLLAVAAFAYGIGGWTHSTAIPPHGPNQAAGETPADVVTVEVTKEVTVTKQVPALPKECSDALQLAAEIEKASAPVINSGDRTTDLLKQARIAITEKNHQKLNDIGTQVNSMQNQTSGATASLLDLQSRLAVKLQDCNHALGR